jgi:hypothetical protein
VTIDPESKAAWYTLQRNLEWSVPRDEMMMTHDDMMWWWIKK